MTQCELKRTNFNHYLLVWKICFD